MSLKFPTAAREPKLSNTREKLLTMLDRGAFTASQLVGFRYRNSRQPEKKLVTITGHLRQLERLGRVRKVGEVWLKV